MIKENSKKVTEHLDLKLSRFWQITGSAAMNFEGKVILCAEVPTCFKRFADLGNQAARNPPFNIDAVSFLIIDEFSIIGCLMIVDT